VRFIDAYDRRNDHGWVTLNELCDQHDVRRRTAYDWLEDRHTYGKPAESHREFRIFRSEQRGTPGSGRPFKIPDGKLKQLLKQRNKSVGSH
jgi:hypothetical protein